MLQLASRPEGRPRLHAGWFFAPVTRPALRHETECPVSARGGHCVSCDRRYAHETKGFVKWSPPCIRVVREYTKNSASPPPDGDLRILRLPQGRSEERR